jgi:hypothetical protein
MREVVKNTTKHISLMRIYKNKRRTENKLSFSEILGIIGGVVGNDKKSLNITETK